MKADVSAIERDLDTALKAIRAALKPEDGSETETRMCEVETFCAIAIRVFRKTNASKIRDEARTVEIYARMHGIPVVEEA